MRNLFKKSLTLCLVAILAFSCFAGIVSAENPFTATIVVENQTITQGTTSVDVVLDITSSEVGINEALIEVSSPLGTIATEATLVSYTTANNEKASIVYPGDSTNYGSFYLSVADDLTTDPSTMGSLSAAEIKVTFTVAADAELKDYDINIAVDGVRAASGNEDVIKFTYEEANISVVAPHVHNVVWTSDKAGNHTSSCDAEGCKDFEAVTEPCADNDADNACDKCGYDLTPATPECTHENAVAVVTTRPTKDTTGLRTYTCECGHSWTEDIPVATLKTAADGDTYKLGINLALNSSIEIGFRVRKAFITDAKSYYAIFKNDVYDKDGNDVGDTTMTKEAVDFTVGLDNANRYDVFYNGLTAMEMGTVVTGDIYRELADGSFEYLTADYSIAYYASLSLGLYGDAFDTLLVDMLNYGAAVQNAYSYNTVNMVTDAYPVFADYADKASTEVGEYENVGSKVNNAGENRLINSSVQLYLKSSIAVVSAVRDLNKNSYTGDMSNMRAKCVYSNYAGGPYTEWIPSSEFQDIGGMLYVVFDKFTTIDLDQPVTIEIYDGDTLVSDTVTYSIASHLLNTPSTDTVNYDVAVKMVKFCAAAAAYF